MSGCRCWPNPSATPSIPTTVPDWRKFNFTYADFSVAGLTKTISLFSLVSGGCIEGIQILETTIFAGPGLGLANVSAGDPAGVDSLTPGILWDLFVAYDAARIYRTPIDVIYTEAAATALTLTMTADINLNLLTAGAFSVWLKLARAQ